ncbi:MAG: DNRLRE domain-containing protein, partial [Planctomycetia bacterium]|nr:DNRLRE domain-containing protein [Planctomycetia bacterium]
LHQLSPVKFGEFDVIISKDKLSEKSNKLPIVNFEISTVSGGEFTAPVWVKFYPSGTYDPDGYILLFEMDMDGDGTFEVSENTLSGGSYEFTVPGNYTTTVRVTDDNGGITTKSKSFVITDSQNIYTEPPEVDQQVDDRKPEDIIVDDKLDSIVEEYKYQNDEPTNTNADKLIYQQEEERKSEDVKLDRRLDSIIEEFKYQDEQPTTTKKVSEIVHQEPIIKEEKSTELILKNEQISEEKMDDFEYDVIEPFKSETVDLAKSEFEKVDQIDNQIYPIADSYVYAYSYRNWNKANFGKHTVLAAGWHSTGGEKRIYIKFDIPNIDPEKLDQAVLRLYHYNTIGKNVLAIGIYQVLENWEEGFGTFHSGRSEPIDSSGVIIWNTQPIIGDSAFIQFKPNKKYKRWLEIDITPFVKEWIGGTPNNGIVLKVEGYLSGRSPISIYEFYSREYEDETKIPALEIKFKE